MKIRAIRLANVGTFAAPTAVEGLSGGLDVLIGPNEMGKSTLFKALHTLFTVQHTTTARIVEALRARAGSGDPIVEADFDMDGAAWRITKRFGRGKLASLADRASGRIVAEGPEAEERLAALVTRGGGAAGGLSLLWAEQGGALEPVAPGEDASAALDAAIAREVESAAGGSTARLLREAVAKALDRHVQPKRRDKAKAGSEYDRALKNQASLRIALNAARVAATAGADRLQRMLDLREQRRAIDGPEAAAARKARHAEAVASLEGGRQAVLGLKSARGDYEAAARRAERAVAELQALDGELQQVSVLAARVAAAVTRRAQLGEALGRAEQAAAEAEKLALRAAENEANALQALTAYERREARLAAASELEQATRTHAAATGLMREIGIARAHLAAQRVNAAAVRELEIVTRDLGAQAARLAAGAPSVRVDYVAGGSARVSLDGRALSDGEELRAIGPVELHIPGVGHITITPAASRERETAAAAARHFEERRLALLAAMQVPDLDAARAALADRQAREQALSGAEARLSGLAGAGDAEQGLAALAARIADFKQRLEVDAGAGEAAVSASREDCAAALAAARENVRVEAAAMATSVGERARLRAELAAIEFDLKRDTAAHAEIEARLPPAAVRAEERARRAGIAATAASEAREAQGAVAALVEHAPDAAAYARLENAARLAAVAEAEAGARATQLREEAALLEGEQRNADEEGIGTRVTALEGEVQRADAEVQRLGREIAELELIWEVLARAEAQTRDNLLAPVVQRVAPYLGLVLPEASVGFGAGFAPLNLQRTGVGEVMGVLSRGTQEQLAILIRLGFGRLLAESGHAVPLVLDDALVYSDDERIARMFAALQLAAQSHQVIVLTCRAAVFSGLGGTRLKLTPWTPKAAA